MFYAVIKRENVKDIEVLSLVLVDSLDLSIEQGIGIESDSALLSNVARESNLDISLDLTPFRAEGGIVGVWFELVEEFKILDPTISNTTCHQGRLLRIGYGDPTPGSDTVGYVHELVRP
jgi:hypothetical protein